MRRAYSKAATAALALALTLVGASDSEPSSTRGQALFERRCAGCHAVDGIRAAPPLRRVFGNPAAQDSRYPYSEALKNARLSWDAATLSRWLADPDVLVPGNEMSFRLDSATERADIIAYLKQLAAK